jgi:hypothetical protein
MSACEPVVVEELRRRMKELEDQAINSRSAAAAALKQAEEFMRRAQAVCLAIFELTGDGNVAVPNQPRTLSQSEIADIIDVVLYENPSGLTPRELRDAVTAKVGVPLARHAIMNCLNRFAQKRGWGRLGEGWSLRYTSHRALSMGAPRTEEEMLAT